MAKQLTRAFLFVLFLFLHQGCKTTDVESGNAPSLKDLPKAQALFEQGKYAEAMIECVDIARKDPLTPGLAELENRIVRRLAEERSKLATMRAENAYGQMSVDADQRKDVPGTYGLRRVVHGDTKPMHTTASNMQQVLDKKITVHIPGEKDGSGLPTIQTFADAIAASDGINMIVGPCTNNVPGMDLKDVPLQEILDYLDKNADVTFYVGDNVIWVTPKKNGQPVAPLVTRLYHLRKGMSDEELGSNTTSYVETTNYIERAITKFVPKTDGADMLFDKKAHLLIVRNTRDNIAKIEELIENLDVCPVQVVIESRFISTTVTDLRELGIDWILKSPAAVTTKSIVNNGQVVNVPESQVNTGTLIGTPSSFSPAAVGAGLSLTYEGLLTDPAFQAVIHALESSGKSRTLSVPKVTTVNNKPAMIRIGQDYRYFENYEVKEIGTVSQIIAGTGIIDTPYFALTPSGSPTVQKLGIELNVTPSVGADMSSVNLKITPNITEKAPTSEWFSYSMPTIGNNNQVVQNTVTIPAFNVSEIGTEVIVKSGETVVMGGLISSTESKTVEGVPFLSSLPLIGRLFKHDSVSQQKENLLVFVTATILSDRGESLIPIDEEARDQATPVIPNGKAALN
jgi:type IV pilus assembly protein PilQ